LESVPPLTNDETQVKNSRFIRDVQQYNSEHFRQNITTEQAAGDIGYNTSYFYTMFKNNFGIPFKQYLNERRIEYATTWLRNLPLPEIASTLGFADYNYPELFMPIRNNAKNSRRLRSIAKSYGMG